MKILAINPGSTSTKISVFNETNEIFTTTLRHNSNELSPFKTVIDQYEFRKNVIVSALHKEKIDIADLDAIVGRGGLVKPIQSGVYKINDNMLSDLKSLTYGEHASNLGAILAKELSTQIKNPKNIFIVDPVVVDELNDIARISGHPLLPRKSTFHALNQKAVARRYAAEVNKPYDELNLIVAHMGGGISVGAHEKGKIIDVNNALSGDGAFSPERTGGVPSNQLAELCFSGQYTKDEIKEMLIGKGGLVALINTNSAIEVIQMIEQGNKEAELVMQAMAYQVAKDIGSNATVLKGKIDAIILTGGVAYNDAVCSWITERVSFIAPVTIYAGEDEMKALVENVLSALNNELPIMDYV